MKIQINIECESIAQFQSHLLKLFEQTVIYMHEESKKDFGLDDVDEFPEDFFTELDDNNCYGSHEVKILKLD